MKKVFVPESVRVRGVEITFESFVMHMLDTDDRFTRNGSGLRAAVRIERYLRAKLMPDAVCTFEDTDLDLLKQAIEAPTAGYPWVSVSGADGSVLSRQSVGRHCISFIDAIAGAIDEKA